MAGTLAGAQSGTTAGDDECDGMAFQGKLAVFDFGDSDSNNALTTPNEVIWVLNLKILPRLPPPPKYPGWSRNGQGSFWQVIVVEIIL